VRSHLRRARTALRQQLDRDPAHARALRGLLLLPAAGAAAAAAGSIAAGVAMKTKMLLGSAAALAALAVVWFTVDGAAEPGTGGARSGDATPAVAAAPNATDAPPEGTASPDVPATRTELARASEPLRLRVTLRGLDPRAPWTTDVRLDLEGYDAPAQSWLEHSDRGVPDAGGSWIAALPAWGLTAERLRLRLQGDDPAYARFDQETEVPDSREVAIDVQVVAILKGRVVDEQGEGVPAARIAAFPRSAGEAQDGVLAQTNSAADGTYVLQAPPDVDLQLVAAAMREASLSGMRMISRHGAITDVGEFRAELLPASQRALGRVGAAATVPDIVLRAAQLVEGAVRWRSGQPVAGARVELRPRGGRTLGLGDLTAIQSIAGVLAPLARRACDDDGGFRLPAPAGVQFDLAVVAVEAHSLHGDFSMPLATAPARVQLELPAPIEVVAAHQGQRRGGALLEVEGRSAVRMGQDGALRVVTDAPLRVRAADGRLQSPWVDLAPADAGGTRVLELREALAEVAVEFDGAFRVRNARFRWQRLPAGQSGAVTRQRDDRGDPFRLFLEPGRYRLTIEPVHGERNGIFLLPSSHELDVAMGSQRLLVPAAFGGTFALAITDARGLHVGGQCRVRDAAGRDCTDRFCVRPLAPDRRDGLPGEVLPGGQNEFTRILPVGDYALELDLGPHGVHRRTVAVVAREVVEVRVRLP
jgi:hypothetical protein